MHPIEEVARIAGVSPITVSRVFNKPDAVSKKTRDAVWAAVEQTGYIPNRLAGGLASKKSSTIGLVIPHIGSSTFADRVQGMTDVLAARGYSLMLALSGYSPEIELQHVMAFLGQRVAGLSLTGTAHAERTRLLLSRSGIPVVEAATLSGDPIDMLVGHSNEDASFTMVEHLANCGYHKIALLSTSPVNNDRTVGRRAGYIRAVAQLGLADDPSLMQVAPIGLSNGAKGFVEILSKHPDVDAVFCADDVFAVGCLLEAKRRGIDVPGDIGIAGFGNIEFAQEFVPALTTVRVQFYNMGALAAQMLLQRIEGGRPEQSVVDLGFEIITRGSTRRPNTP